MNQPGSPARDDEPSPGGAGRGGSVVLPDLQRTIATFHALNDSMARMGPAIERTAAVLCEAIAALSTDDAMRWSPSAEGEEIPSCPA